MAGIRAEMISYRANGMQASGYLAHPDTGGPCIGLVAIQEYWGLEPHIKDVVGRFAQAGYCALAPDLYHGRVAAEPDEARKLSMELDLPQAMKEIEGAAAYLASRADVQPKQVGIVGWCMGGRLALQWASTSSRAATAVAFYPGRYLPDAGQAGALRVPALILYGEEDHGIPPGTREHVERELRAAGKIVEIHTYRGAGHAFFNDSKPSFHPEAATDAWRRTLDWLEVHMKLLHVGGKVGT